MNDKADTKQPETNDITAQLTYNVLLPEDRSQAELLAKYTMMMNHAYEYEKGGRPMEAAKCRDNVDKIAFAFYCLGRKIVRRGDLYYLIQA